MRGRHFAVHTHDIRLFRTFIFITTCLLFAMCSRAEYGSEDYGEDDTTIRSRKSRFQDDVMNLRFVVFMDDDMGTSDIHLLVTMASRCLDDHIISNPRVKAHIVAVKHTTDPRISAGAIGIHSVVTQIRVPREDVRTEKGIPQDSDRRYDSEETTDKIETSDRVYLLPNTIVIATGGSALRTAMTCAVERLVLMTNGSDTTGHDNCACYHQRIQYNTEEKPERRFCSVDGPLLYTYDRSRKIAEQWGIPFSVLTKWFSNKEESLLIHPSDAFIDIVSPYLCFDGRLPERYERNIRQFVHEATNNGIFSFPADCYKEKSMDRYPVNYPVDDMCSWVEKASTFLDDNSMNPEPTEEDFSDYWHIAATVKSATVALVRGGQYVGASEYIEKTFCTSHSKLHRRIVVEPVETDTTTHSSQHDDRELGKKDTKGSNSRQDISRHTGENRDGEDTKKVSYTSGSEADSRKPKTENTKTSQRLNATRVSLYMIPVLFMEYLYNFFLKCITYTFDCIAIYAVSIKIFFGIVVYGITVLMSYDWNKIMTIVMSGIIATSIIAFVLFAAHCKWTQFYERILRQERDVSQQVSTHTTPQRLHVSGVMDTVTATETW